MNGSGNCNTTHKKLISWVEQIAKLCQPEKILWCDGSDEENQAFCDLMVKAGTFTKLNEKKRPGSYLARSHPSDVARVEDRTYICSQTAEEAGPTNNWADPAEMKQKMLGLFKGCMKGRTMYVIPFAMGPLDSPICKVGIEISDSPYVVVNMRIMTRMGKAVHGQARRNGAFIPCMHSVGAPLSPDKKMSPGRANPIRRTNTSFISQTSLRSGPTAPVTAAMRCSARNVSRCASLPSSRKSEGWMAEHMLILCLTSPQGKKHYVAAAFPSACGKTNLAMMQPTLPGWKVTTLGDDIAWIRVGKDGRLYAMNPETGFFGVAPGTSANPIPTRCTSCAKNTIFTNVVLHAGRRHLVGRHGRARAGKGH